MKPKAYLHWIQTNKGTYYLGYDSSGYEALVDKEGAARFRTKEPFCLKYWVNEAKVFARGTKEVTNE